MPSLQPHLTSFLKSLPPPPVNRNKLDELVRKTLSESQDKCSPENRKSQWEYLLKNDVFLLAANEGKALSGDPEEYYDDLSLKLDIILCFTEHEACEQTFPLLVLQELLETQTIGSCSRIFSWMETRADKLTEGMVPQKGKALVLLRTLNDLLRRLSKVGSTTIFCGRILTFLSGVFALGERSGVNLRGEYGPTWEGVQRPDKMRVDEEPSGANAESTAESDKMDVDNAKTSVAQNAEKKEDFYDVFWSLQLPFSKPPLFAKPETFGQFKEAVGRVLPVIKEATAKERAMMGSRAGLGPANTLKRKRELDEETNSNNEYFFAKFLTSPDLLDLEIADTHFRRQFLFQLLILLNHLLTFTKDAKSTWVSPRNRSLQMDFTLEESEAQWVHETLNKVTEELRQTTPNGRTFADTASALLEREKNWVKWKNELCTTFDKDPWSEEIDGKKVGLFEATKSIRDKMKEPPNDWEYKLGTAALTEIWETGYTDLEDLKNPFQPGEVKDFVKRIKQEDAKINLRKQRLERIAKSKAAAAPAPAKTPVENPTPAIVISSTETHAATQPDTTHRSEPTPGTLAAPRPVSGMGNSPIHPSLPPKPGSPSKPASSSQEPVKSATSSPSIAPIPSPVPAPVAAQVPAPAPEPVDPEIAKYEENKQQWAWLALRAARDLHLQHFGKIGTGDIEQLAQEIEKEKENRSKGLVVEEPGPVIEEGGQKDGEGDVKMDG
ncbi:hypothetical protein D9613_004115 [Agrocybe pediades]|uniref:THO complex subunit 1 n=1 Tax=Agrocybe pediades TaxID=84607 RepID=A0A8H4VIZ3_9AGAR|nr:hypothetical protein D9613_004115 [Agrocybe pediades]